MRECTRPHKLNTAVQRRVRAGQKNTAGRMWPAGRSLPTPRLAPCMDISRPNSFMLKTYCRLLGFSNYKLQYVVVLGLMYQPLFTCWMKAQIIHSASASLHPSYKCAVCLFFYDVSRNKI